MILLPGEVIRHSSETYNKEEGTLYYTSKRLAWCKTGTETPAIEVLHENFRVQQVSKAEAKKVMLRVSAVPPGSSPDAQPTLIHTLTWKMADKQAAIADREKYVAELSILTSRRAQGANAGQQAAQSAQATGAQSNAATPQEAPTDDKFGKVKIGAVPASAEEIKLREEVLSKNLELAKVHKSLVVSGLISEDEFWSTRKHVLETQAIQSQLRKGETSAWLDLERTIQESGNFKYTITPNIARRIFKEYPQVKRAYVENVPHKVSEKIFWKRFVESQFFNRGRSSNSTSGSRDPIFDKCAQEEDTVFNDSKRFDFDFLSKLLDLTRTEEDSVETGNGPDFTMRTPSKDSKLSLIRRFNHHSELVLQSVLSSKRRLLSASAPDHKIADKALEAATVLDDLETAVPEKKVKLNIQDRSRYFTSLVKDKGSQHSSAAGERISTDPEAIRAALHVSFDISRPLANSGDTQKTMASMSNAIHKLTMLNRQNRIEELRIPEEISVAVAECHGAGTEMLRHLWALLRLPPTTERQQKTERIVSALSGVEQRIRETIVKANAIKSKNAQLGATIEKMLQPITDSLEAGKAAFDGRPRGAAAAASYQSPQLLNQ